MTDWRDDAAEIMRRSCTEDVSSLILEVDCNDRPLVLWTAWDAGRLTVDELVALIPEAWVGAEWPLGGIGERAWHAMYKAAGYVWQVYSYGDGSGGFLDDVDVTRQPDHPVTMYRVAKRPERCRGRSTSNGRAGSPTARLGWVSPRASSGRQFLAKQCSPCSTTGQSKKAL